MPKTEAKQSEINFPKWFLQKHFEIFFKVALITLIPMAVLGGIGYAADKFIGKFPLCTAIGIIVAFIFSQVMIFKTFTSVTRKKN